MALALRFAEPAASASLTPIPTTRGPGSRGRDAGAQSHEAMFRGYPGPLPLEARHIVFKQQRHPGGGRDPRQANGLVIARCLDGSPQRGTHGACWTTGARSTLSSSLKLVVGAGLRRHDGRSGEITETRETCFGFSPPPAGEGNHLLVGVSDTRFAEPAASASLTFGRERGWREWRTSPSLCVPGRATSVSAVALTRDHVGCGERGGGSYRCAVVRT